jgi:hypothetical protein
MIKKLVAVLSLIAILVVVHSASRTEKPVPVREWNVADSKAYAHDVVQAWADNQYLCLEKLWKKESNWRANAYNKVKVMGKNAGGIPQILGLDPRTSPPLQIDRGFAYIMHRYGTPCMAWKFHQRKGWY